MELKLVEFETAKLAKEVGFNHMKANCYGDNMAYNLPEGNLINALKAGNNYILAPTQALLQTWLRLTWLIELYVKQEASGSDDYEWSYVIKYENKSAKRTCNRITTIESFYWYSGGYGNTAKSDTYETALESGLIRALEILQREKEIIKRVLDETYH